MNKEVLMGYDVPKELKRRVVNVIKRFTITGECDPMYIANTIAYQNNMGDGYGSFNGEVKHVSRKTAEYLQYAYSHNILESEIDELWGYMNGEELTVNAADGVRAFIKRLKVEKKTCDSWRKDYLNKVIREAKANLASL